MFSSKARAARKAIQHLLDDASLSDTELVARLAEVEPAQGRFRALTQMAREIYARNPRVMSPFLAMNISPWLLDWPKGEIEAWMDELEANGDVDLFRTALVARMRGANWWQDRDWWRKSLIERFERAESLEKKRQTLEMWTSGWFDLEDEVAAEFYPAAPDVVTEMIERTVKRDPWDDFVFPLTIEVAEKYGRDENYYRLYRCAVLPEQWVEDVAAIAEEIRDPARLLDELEKRHPDAEFIAEFSLAGGFLKLVEARGEAVLPYVLKHLKDFAPYVPEWAKLFDLAREREWWPLWAALGKSFLAPGRFNEEIVRICEGSRSEARKLDELLLLAGAENWTWSGLSPHRLDQKSANALYATFPELARGPFRGHWTVQENYWRAPAYDFGDVRNRAQKQGDVDFVDFLASRVCEVAVLPSALRWGGKAPDLSEWLAIYAALDADTWVSRVSNVLAKIRTWEQWQGHLPARHNALFAHIRENAGRFLASEEGRDALVDLLESPNTHVCALALRVIARGDHAVTADMARRALPHLLAFTLGERPRAMRIDAFRALAAAATGDETTATVVLQRVRMALEQRYISYPRDRALELIARLIAAHPGLRDDDEEAVVHTWTPRTKRRHA